MGVSPCPASLDWIWQSLLSTGQGLPPSRGHTGKVQGHWPPSRGHTGTVQGHWPPSRGTQVKYWETGHSPGGTQVQYWDTGHPQGSTQVQYRDTGHLKWAHWYSTGTLTTSRGHTGTVQGN